MNITKKTIGVLSVTAVISGVAGSCAFADLQSPPNTFTLRPEFSMDSGDYGGGDTIKTYAMSVTGSYDFSRKWNVSLTVVPYLHQNETYTDVVLVGGRPVHHTDSIGGNPHHPGDQIPSSLHPENYMPSSSSPGDYIPSSSHLEEQMSSASSSGQQISGSLHPGDYVPTTTQPGSYAPSTSQSVNNTTTSNQQTTSGANNISQATAGQTVEQKVKRHGSASGIGDAFVNLSYKLFEEDETMPGISLHAGVKLPTADEDKGLGTGELDYQMGVGLGKGVGRWFLYGGLDYNILGDPDYYDLDNYISGYASIATEVLDNMEVSLQLSAAQAATDVSDDSFALGVGVNYFLGKYGMVTAGLQNGFTDGSPDYSLVVGYSISF